MKKLLFAMAVGAALAYLFDPEAGGQRRADLRHRLEDKGLLRADAQRADTQPAAGVAAFSPPAAVATVT